MKIVFFDGDCNLCNFFVDFLIRHDTKRQLKFASLQGETARQTIPQYATPPYSSVVFYDGKTTQIESAAALEALAELGSGWKTVLAFKAIPAFIRDAIYHYTAENRYKWFGKKETCRIPTPEEKDYFLP